MTKLIWISLLVCSCQIHVVKAQWTLQECVDYALEHNLELQQQMHEIRIKDYDFRIVRNERLPLIHGYSNVYSNFGHSQDVFGTIQRNDNLNSNMGITAEIMLYNFGRLRNQAHKAQVEVDMEAIELEIAERELTTKVVQSYLEILMQEALLSARDSAVQFSNKLYERAKYTTEVGTTAQSVVYEAKANLARERQQLENVRIDLERARLQLSQLLQLNDYATFSVSPLPTDTLTGFWDVPTLESLITKSYHIQPSMQRYTLWQTDLTLQEQLVRAQLYPTINASTSIGSTYFNAFRMPMTDPFFAQARNNFAQQIAVTATVPIFNKGRTRNQLRQLKVVAEQLEVRQQLERQLVRQQVEKIYMDYRTNYQNLIQANEALTQTRLALEFAEKSYAAGQISIYELNTSRNNFIQAESESLQARYSTLFSHKMLQYQISYKFDAEANNFSTF